MKRKLPNYVCGFFFFYVWLTSLAWGQGADKSADLNALSKVPPAFEVTPSEPMVRQPSTAFVKRVRMFVGMGPRYRNSTPEPPGDSVMMSLDTDDDGRANRTQEFATGFNAIQGIARHGRESWIANAPDLTVVRDLDGDNEADEHVKAYTDLGNLEHGLHGLNWPPGGRLYMSPKIRGRSLQVASAATSAVASESKFEPYDGVASVRNVEVKNGTVYRVVASGFVSRSPAYVDRSYLANFLLSMRTSLTAATANTVAIWHATNTTVLSRNQSAATDFGVEEQKDRLRISLGGQPIVDFVFRDERILRPYFANARVTNGVQVTRNHPPITDVDPVDHDTMHPGIWLGFGDISGQDFWRNKATMEHVRFVTPPTTSDGQLRFATECRLKTNNGELLCLLTNDFTLTSRPNGWLLVWNAEFRADQREIVFGDQEEMGLGARVATSFTEKNGGVIRSSTGRKSAKETWGQPAQWCDYSGTGPQSGGILLMASERNFRESWWHNRDYGVFVANPFGREAMKQGARSAVTVKKGEALRLVYAAMVHDGNDYNPASEYENFLERLKE